MRYTLVKANPVETEDGELTARGMEVAEQYAQAWVNRNARDLSLERMFPELEGLFYDIRIDPALARRHATPANPKMVVPIK